MRYVHRIVFRATHAEIAELRELGMTLDCGAESYDKTRRSTLFLVAEDHPHWPIIQTRMREWKDPGHIVYTEFTPRELDAARWLDMTAWDNGSVVPREDMKFYELLYDQIGRAHV